MHTHININEILSTYAIKQTFKRMRHIHMSHKITPLKTNKSAHKATQTVKDILQPMNTA
jgi:hypothetical protein